jgi:hypothetical protein
MGYVKGIRTGVLHPSQSKIKGTGKVKTVKLPGTNNPNTK